MVQTKIPAARTLDQGTRIPAIAGQIQVSIGCRELPELVCLIADLQDLLTALERGAVFASDAADALRTILDGWTNGPS